MDTVFRKKRIAGCESGDRFSIHGGVPKWLKGPDSKSGRSASPAQEFESLHLRQKERHALRVSFFLGSGRRRRSPSFEDQNARGRQSRPCAKIFACGENACTAQTRRPVRRPVGESSLHMTWGNFKISVLTAFFLQKAQLSSYNHMHSLPTCEGRWNKFCDRSDLPHL